MLSQHKPHICYFGDAYGWLRLRICHFGDRPLIEFIPKQQIDTNE
ncbi:MAG: hypothetical protein V7L04_08965 [Nostoc sp.]|nr:hypothetical protein [Nostoc sp. S13]MDF5734856.1 hypothetical protein [Nostoc sp. S13]